MRTRPGLAFLVILLGSLGAAIGLAQSKPQQGKNPPRPVLSLTGISSRE